MTKMRQTANGGFPRLGQKTPDAHGETPTISEMNFAPAAFNLNQSSAVCLPLVSQGQRLIWVNSNQINLQLDGAAELDKAFDRFPYLTQKQTAELAQRCSLHPDQVKVWFMLQRLRYGISWDYNDIREVRAKFKSSRRKEEPQNMMRTEVKEDRREKKKQKTELKGDRREKKKQKTEVKESGGNKAGEVREEDVCANERLERDVKQPLKREKDREVEKIEEDNRNTQKKRKRMTVTDKVGKKRTKQQEEGAGGVEITSEKVERQWETTSTQSDTMPFTRKKKKAKANKRLLSTDEWPDHKRFAAPAETSPSLVVEAFDAPPPTDEQSELQEGVHVSPSSAPNVSVTPADGGFEGKPEMEAWRDGELLAESTNYDNAVTDVVKLKRLINDNQSPRGSTHGPDTPKKQQDSQKVVTPPSRIRWRTKTQNQLVMMKEAFSHCQYPDSEQYDLLATQIGVPRYTLVQWFGDMRYYIKRGKPGWLNEEQHSKALANIKYRQFLKALTKEQSSEGDRKATAKMKMEGGGSYDDGERTQVPSE